MASKPVSVEEIVGGSDLMSADDTRITTELKGTQRVLLDVCILDDDEGQQHEIHASVRNAMVSVSLQLGVDACLQTSKGFEDSDTFEKHLFPGNNPSEHPSEHLPTLVLCDVALKQRNGIEIAKDIAKRSFPTDVVVYSKGAQSEEVRVTNRYGRVFFAKDKSTLDPKITACLWGIVSRWDDPEYMRGLMLSRIGDVEAELDLGLMFYFNRGKDAEAAQKRFKKEFLHASQTFTFEPKFRLMDSILKGLRGADTPICDVKDDKYLNDTWQKLGKRRNSLAHGGVEKSEDGGIKITRRKQEDEVYSREVIIDTLLGAYDSGRLVQELNTKLSALP